MESIFMAIISALWLGILSSISPCPMATNIAAVSYLRKLTILNQFFSQALHIPWEE